MQLPEGYRRILADTRPEVASLNLTLTRICKILAILRLFCIRAAYACVRILRYYVPARTPEACH
eukprot:scaffold481518_cov15-Prasinocladus_malaysianus.AAC.1